MVAADDRPAGQAGRSGRGQVPSRVEEKGCGWILSDIGKADVSRHRVPAPEQEAANFGMGARSRLGPKGLGQRP